MSEINKTIEDLGKAFETFKDSNDERLKEIEKKDHADPLLEEKVDKINKDISDIGAMKKNLEDVQASVERMKQLPASGEAQISADQKEHATAFTNYIKTGVEGNLRNLEIKAELSTQSDPGAGWLVTDEIEKNIDRVAGTISTMRAHCNVKKIGTDVYTKYVSQGGTGSGWVGEQDSRGETDTPTLKEITINMKEIYAMPITTQKMLDIGIINIPAWLGEEVAEKFVEEEGDGFITGNGVLEPKGLNDYTKVANASYEWGKIGYIASGSTAITSTDTLIKLYHALKSKYRNGAEFMMNDATFSTIRQLKNGEGDYIWRAGLERGESFTILGKPVFIDENVDSEGSTKYPVYFADWKRAYIILDMGGVRVLRDDLTTKGKVKFYSTKYVGGGLGHYEPIKCIRTA